MNLYSIYEYYWHVNDLVKNSGKNSNILFLYYITLIFTYLEIKTKYLPFEFSYYYDNMILQNNSNYLEQNWNMLGVSVE